MHLTNICILFYHNRCVALLFPLPYCETASEVGDWDSRGSNSMKVLHLGVKVFPAFLFIGWPNNSDCKCGLRSHSFRLSITAGITNVVSLADESWAFNTDVRTDWKTHKQNALLAHHFYTILNTTILGIGTTSQDALLAHHFYTRKPINNFMLFIPFEVYNHGNRDRKQRQHSTTDNNESNTVYYICDISIIVITVIKTKMQNQDIK